MQRGAASQIPGRRPRKWRVLALYWVAQAAFIYLAWPALMCNDLGELTGVPRMWSDSEFAGWTLFAIALLTAGQVAFVLPVTPPRHQSSRVGRWTRHVIAGVALGTIAALTWPLPVLFTGWALGVGQVFEDEEWLWVFLASGAIVCVAATVVLRLRYPDRTPIGVSIAIAGAASVALLLGAAVAIMEGVDQATGSDLIDGGWACLVPGSIVLGWTVGTPLIWAFVRRGPRETRVQRLASLLFLGTVVEAVAVIPLDVMVRRKTDCYCGEGTFWSLVLCGSVGFLMLGPGVFFLLGRRRKRWLMGRCEVCEYDMSGCMDAERCPECGAGWKRRAAGGV